MRINVKLNFLFIIIISSIISAQSIITFDDQGWNSDQVLDSAFNVGNFKVSSSQKFCTNYGCNFDINSVSVYFVFHHKTDQITVTASNNLHIDLNSFDVYQVSEQSTDTLVIEGWTDSVKEYSKSFTNDTTWKTLTLNYKSINKIIVKLDSSDNGGISDYNFDNFSFSISPLPVELTEFKAVTESNHINLQWKTATELNNYGFEIERKMTNDNQSHSSIVNSQWSKVGFVKGNGTGTTPTLYSFTDNSARNGNKYKYRLKQLDFNGDYKYSSEIEAEANLIPIDYSLSQNYPNPFNPSTTINYNIPQDGKVVLKIYDILGSEISTLIDENKAAGSYSVKFSETNLSSGIYIYKLVVSSSTGSGQVYVSTKKMILLK
jgi:Secretion system C-terminal sorting domain